MVVVVQDRGKSVRIVLEPFSWPLWRFAQLRSLRERTDETAVSGCLLNMVMCWEIGRMQKFTSNAVCLPAVACPKFWSFPKAQTTHICSDDQDVRNNINIALALLFNSPSSSFVI
jgi:hypothetical protein